MRRNRGARPQRERGPVRRQGAALLEAIVALSVLVTAGVSVVALAAQSADAVHQARDREGRLREASAFLEAVALWPRVELDQRLGTRAQGPWRLRVERPTSTLYLVSLADSMAPHIALLSTALYRPELAANAGP